MSAPLKMEVLNYWLVLLSWERWEPHFEIMEWEQDILGFIAIHPIRLDVSAVVSAAVFAASFVLVGGTPV